MAIAVERLLARVGERASRVSPGAVAKTIVALPFYLLGFIAGAIWFVIAWSIAGIVIGFTDGARRRKPTE